MTESRLKLPRIDAGRLGKGFVMIQGRRRLAEVIDRLGKGNIQYLIEKDKDLSHFLSHEKEEEYRKSGKGYAWLGNLLTDEDFLSMIPSWATELVKGYGEKGEQWLKRQVAWLRAFVTL